MQDAALVDVDGNQYGCGISFGKGFDPIAVHTLVATIIFALRAKMQIESLIRYPCEWAASPDLECIGVIQ